jgi:hypothetical protein
MVYSLQLSWGPTFGSCFAFRSIGGAAPTYLFIYR